MGLGVQGDKGDLGDPMLVVCIVCVYGMDGGDQGDMRDPTGLSQYYHRVNTYIIPVFTRYLKGIFQVFTTKYVHNTYKYLPIPGKYLVNLGLTLLSKIPGKFLNNT